MPRKKSGNFDQREYENEYKKTHYKKYTLRFSIDSDQDVIEEFESVSNKQDYIRNLVRADIAGNPALITALEAAIADLQSEKDNTDDPDVQNAFAVSITAIIHSVENTTTLQYDWKSCKFKS